jgi:m7GpppX diphosphatase
MPPASGTNPPNDTMDGNHPPLLNILSATDDGGGLGGRILARTLTVSDQHATLLLTATSSAPAQRHPHCDGRCIDGAMETVATTTTTSSSSIIKLTLVPYHKSILGSNPALSIEDIERNQRPERNAPSILLDDDDDDDDGNQRNASDAAARRSEGILSFLRGCDYELKSESGVEYGYYTARPRRRGRRGGIAGGGVRGGLIDETRVPTDDDDDDDVNYENAGAFDVEVISPATPHQIHRLMPCLGHVLIRETPEVYRDVVMPYVKTSIDNGSTSWIRNVVSGTREMERILVNEADFLINVDTKWRSHPPPLSTPRECWRGHSCVADLYCLGIAKVDGISCMRDLRSVHVPMLRSMERTGLDAIRDVYGVSEDQIRVYVHYPPQFYHFHVHYTRLENEVGCSVERGHLVSDIVQNLEMDDLYYTKRIVTYKLQRGSTLHGLIEDNARNVAVHE